MDHDFIPVECDEETYEPLLEMVAGEASGSNTLIIIDDLASSKSIKSQSCKATSIAMHGRHTGLSVIIITQQYTSIALSYRLQASWIVAFCFPDGEDAEAFMKKHFRGYSKEEKERILNYLKKEEYAYIIVQKRNPRKRFMGLATKPITEI